MTEIADAVSGLGKQGSDVRTTSKPKGLFGPSYEQIVIYKIIL